jgi:hypothetical protein
MQMARIAALTLVSLLAAAAAPSARPAAEMEYPILVAAVVSTAVAVAQTGRQLEASVRVAAMIIPPQRITCRATLGTRALKGAPYFRPGRASCRWALPAGSKGKTAAGSIAVTINGKTVVKRFTKRIK